MMLVPKNLNEPYCEMAQVRWPDRDRNEVVADRSTHVSQPRRLIGHALIRVGRAIAADGQTPALRRTA